MPNLTIDGATVAFTIRPSGRARRLRLTVGPAGIEVVVPTGISERQVLSFVHSHSGWIGGKLAELQTQLADHPGAVELGHGARIPLRGGHQRLRVEPQARVHPKLLQDAAGLRLLLPQATPPARQAAVIEQTLVRWLRQAARADGWAAIERHGGPHGLVPSALVIKEQKRLWGSCTAQGVINLNWRLVLAPPAVLDYVVVHELCHLRHRHHRPTFWRLVGQVLPGFEQERAWLKTHGHRLTLLAPATPFLPFAASA